MQTELDQLMVARELDALVVSGKVLGNPPLVYLLNGAHLTQVLLIKKCGEQPQLVVSPIEREEAGAAGYPVILNTRYGYADLLREYGGDVLAAAVAYQQQIFADLGVTGRVGFYGYGDQGERYEFLKALAAATPTIAVVGEYTDNVLRAARATKDAREVARIQAVARRTEAVVAQTVSFLQQHAVGADEVLRKSNGAVLTVGDVHAHIRRWVALQDLESPEGFVFATGRDAGIPHSRGQLTAPLRLGESIVFDIFPREMGGGYFFDMTRTFCLGYAPEPLQRLYADVQAVLAQVKSAIQVGQSMRAYQQMACALFEQRGHPTIAEDPAALSGYVHGLGHGVGLDIHEAPSFQDTLANIMTVEPGYVFTIEPGLYYPEQGMGCRLEDVVWIDPAGQVVQLTDFPYQLVVPMG